jgi:hypothetical protein
MKAKISAKSIIQKNKGRRGNAFLFNFPLGKND